MIDLSNAQSRKGAADALSLLIAAKNGPIRLKNGPNGSDKDGPQLKMPKNVETVDVEQEERDQNDAADKPNETAAEKEKRLERIKDANTAQNIQKDLDNIQQDMINKDAAEKAAAKADAAVKHREEMRKKGKLISSGVMRLDYDDFYDDLENAIKDQIHETNRVEDSYYDFNSTYANSDLLMPGEEFVEEKFHPVINVYIDNSGSLPDEVVQEAISSLSFLNALEAQDELEYTVYFFGDFVYKYHEGDSKETIRAHTGRKTEAFPRILDHVVETRADNVIIFTDSDFDRQSGDLSALPYVKVDGCVWWIWAQDRMAVYAWPHLTSKDSLSTYHYKI